MAEMTFEDRPIMKCGCVAMVVRTDREGREPWCLTHDCGEVADAQPDLSGRRARCTYFGKPVKTGSYNSNACSSGCKAGGVCGCERPSSRELWFFVYKPEAEYDLFYCACHGAD